MIQTKDLVGAQCVRKQSGVNLLMIQTISKNLIYADDVEEVYGTLDFDDIYIKAGIDWSLNQTNIVEMYPQLSYDVITNEFRALGLRISFIIEEGTVSRTRIGLILGFRIGI